MYTADQIDDFRKKLRLECAARAEQVVGNVRDSGLLERLGQDPSKNPEISRDLEAAFRSIIREID